MDLLWIYCGVTVDLPLIDCGLPMDLRWIALLFLYTVVCLDLWSKVLVKSYSWYNYHNYRTVSLNNFLITPSTTNPSTPRCTVLIGLSIPQYPKKF